MLHLANPEPKTIWVCTRCLEPLGKNHTFPCPPEREKVKLGDTLVAIRDVAGVNL